MSGKEIEHVPQSALGGMDVPMEVVVERASSIATNLAAIIKDKQLFTMIEGKAYVHVEGWTTLGALLGVLPKERGYEPVNNGYRATVDLVKQKDGTVIGGASAICTRDERGKNNFKDYALYSMAQTRATGKAYRLAFSWIMKLAGYEATPWEEMQDVINVQAKEAEELERELNGDPYTFARPTTAPQSDGKPRIKNQWEQDIVDKIDELQLFQARPHIINVLNRSPFFEQVPYGELNPVEALAYALRWVQVKNENPEMDVDERNKIVNDSWDEALPTAYENLGLETPEGI